MINFDNIFFSFNSNPYIIIAGCLILILFTYFMYKITVPAVAPFFKGILTAIRALSLIALFLLIFEPKLTIVDESEEIPMHYIFIDNSSSMVLADSSATADLIRSIAGREAESSAGIRVYTFGNEIKPLDQADIDSINFKETQTNFQKIFDFIQGESSNLASAAIISDGIITEGSNPVYSAEKIGVPVYTVGSGDTTQRKDIELNQVIYNQYIYSSQPTLISISVKNSGFVNRPVTVSFFENNKLVGSKSLLLDRSGLKKVEFEYVPGSPGEQKLGFTLTRLKDEVTFANNSKTVFVNVLKSKLKILLISSSLSTDFSFIKNSLSKNLNNELYSLAQLTDNLFLGDPDIGTLIDSSDIFYLIGFPSKITSKELADRVFDALRNGRPFFMLLSNGTDLTRLKGYNRLLPFEVLGDKINNLEVQPILKEAINPLFSSAASDPLASWSGLPPLPILTDQIRIRPGSTLLASSRSNNVELEIPLIVSRSMGNDRSIAVLAGNIWRWKLLESQKDNILFDSFIQQTAKWLNTPKDSKRVNIASSKKIYTLRDEIRLNAQIYDETFNPLDNAEVVITLKGENDNFDLYLTSTGQGIYTGTIESLTPGDYRFEGRAKLADKILGEDEGKFSVSDIEIEKINQRADHDLLRLISNLSGGRYYTLSNSDKLIDKLTSENPGRIRTSIKTTEINLWSSEYLLVAVILLLGAEWFFRKRSGML